MSFYNCLNYICVILKAECRYRKQENESFILKINIMDHLLFLNLGTGELIIIAIIVLLLFGGKKIPELMNGLGKGVKSFKDGMNDVQKELKNDTTKEENKDADKK